MRLEIDMKPFTTNHGCPLCGSSHHGLTNTPALMRRVYDGVDEESVRCPIPDDVNERNQIIVPESPYPGEAVSLKPFCPRCDTCTLGTKRSTMETRDCLVVRREISTDVDRLVHDDNVVIRRQSLVEKLLTLCQAGCFRPPS